jgi:hypothetical protein
LAIYQLIELYSSEHVYFGVLELQNIEKEDQNEDWIDWDLSNLICLLFLIFQVNIMIGFQIKPKLCLLFPIISIYLIISLHKYSYSKTCFYNGVPN